MMSPVASQPDLEAESVTTRQATGYLELVLDGEACRVDSAAYAGSSSARRRHMDAILAELLERLCRTSTAPQILRTAAAIAAGNSALHCRVATLLMRALLSEDPGVRANSRLAPLIITLGLMDVRQGRVSALYRFMLCLTGLRVTDAGSGAVPGLLSAVVSRLIGDSSLIGLLSPATISLIGAFCWISGEDAGPYPRLSTVRTADMRGYADVTWPLALRLGVFLLRLFGRSDVLRADLARAVLFGAVAEGHRQPDGATLPLLKAARAHSPLLALVADQVAFEEDPDEFGRQRGSTTHLFRHVRPADTVEVAMASDGSEIIGYEREMPSGEVVAVERNQFTAPLRGSKGRRRWNNEPALRARFSEATVTPNGLVMFDRDAILEFEFANVPNRSGAVCDRYHLSSYPELTLSSDRSAVLTAFPIDELERGLLLSGLPNMGNFGHFMLNGVSKFPVFRDQIDAGWSVVVAAQRAWFHDAIVSYCGLDPTRFVFTERRRGLRAGLLDVVSEAPLGVIPYNLIAALRAGLPRPRPTGGPRRVYLTRPEGARRSLTNEDALIEMLSGYGFVAIRPELMSFSEQVAVLDAADVVVAPHGSALHTLLFCFRPKRVVEIKTKVCIWLSQYNFLGHQIVRVPSSARPLSVTRSAEDAAYTVDLDVARQAVVWAVGGSGTPRPGP